MQMLQDGREDMLEFGGWGIQKENGEDSLKKRKKILDFGEVKGAHL